MHDHLGLNIRGSSCHTVEGPGLYDTYSATQGLDNALPHLLSPALTDKVMSYQKKCVTMGSCHHAANNCLVHSSQTPWGTT